MRPAAPVLLAACLAGCAAPSASPGAIAAPDPGAPGVAARGEVLIVRAGAPRPASRLVLARLGRAAPAEARVAEIVIRADDGRILSIVQDAEAGLRPGQRVTVLSGKIPRAVPE